MKFIKLVTYILLALSVAACSRHSSFISAAVDPTYSPLPTDPIFLTLSDEPTIKERQLLSILKEELCRNGFNIVNAAEDSKWTLNFSYGRQTYQFGSRSSAFIVPGRIPMMHGTTTPNIVTDSSVYLNLFTTSSYLTSKPIRVWESTMTVNNRVFQVYEPIIFKNVLDVFGKNLERSVRLSKAYLHNPGSCASATSGNTKN